MCIRDSIRCCRLSSATFSKHWLNGLLIVRSCRPLSSQTFSKLWLNSSPNVMCCRPLGSATFAELAAWRARHATSAAERATDGAVELASEDFLVLEWTARLFGDPVRTGEQAAQFHRNWSPLYSKFRGDKGKINYVIEMAGVFMMCVFLSSTSGAAQAALIWLLNNATALSHDTEQISKTCSVEILLPTLFFACLLYTSDAADE